MLGYFLVSVARNLLLHCSSVLRVSREGGKCSLHGKTLRWRIVLCAVTNLLRTAHILAVTLKNVMSTSKSSKDSDKGLNVSKFDHGSTDGKGEKWQKWLTLLSSAFGQSYPMFAMQLNDVPEPIDSPDGSKL